MPSLNDIEHLLFLFAEDVPLSALPALPEPLIHCPGYHHTPAGEERETRLWPAYAVALREAGHTVHLRASVPDTLGDVTVIEARAATVASVLDSLDALPPATLVAIALGGDDPTSGTLLLHTPWAGDVADGQTDQSPARDRTDQDDAYDHTSLMRLCERWTAARGREARAALSEERREAYGNLVAVLDLTEPADEPADAPDTAPAEAPLDPDTQE